MTPEQRRNMRIQEMQKEWHSWEELIQRDLERLEHRIQACYAGMATFSISRDMREQFVTGKLREMIIKIAEGA